MKKRPIPDEAEVVAEVAALNAEAFALESKIMAGGQKPPQRPACPQDDICKAHATLTAHCAALKAQLGEPQRESAIAAAREVAEIIVAAESEPLSFTERLLALKRGGSLQESAPTCKGFTARLIAAQKRD